ncbi:MAG: hypothetical protein R2745_06185 [Vicinamibacterales bacterium]
MTLGDLAGTSWHGTAALWLDPLGDRAETSPCLLHVEADAVRYTWAWQDTPHEGRITVGPAGGTFTDTFHSRDLMPCAPGPGTWALLDLVGTYGVAPGPPWGWRIFASLRPADGDAPEALVLQMTNIAPWGEETRAVRMIARRG